MARLLLTVVAVLVSVFSSECRQGWKTDGNGYLVYSAVTKFKDTGTLSISGKLSNKNNSQIKNVLLAFEDGDGNFTGQVTLDGDVLGVGMMHGSVLQSMTIHSKLNTGYEYDFTCTLSQTMRTNATFYRSIRISVTGLSGAAVSVPSSERWNLDTMKIFIGGYSKSMANGKLFQGCLSDFMFQGTDMIGTYFSQYPTNTNPVRSSFTVGQFSNVAQMCGDLKRTTPAPKTQPITKPSGGIRNTATASIVLFGAFLAFSHFM